MMKLFKLFTSVALVSFILDVTMATSTFRHLGDRLSHPYSVILDQERRLKLEWYPDYETSNVDFRITGSDVTPETWFGVGFSDYGDTADADFVIYWTGSKGIHHFQDAHTDGAGTLLIDKSQDYLLQKARTVDHMTTLEFRRKFDTCDEEDYTFDRGTTHVIFFFSPERPSSINKANLTQQTVGLQRVQLLKPEVDDPPLPEDTWTIEVTNPAITVPDTETTYWWYIAKLPALPQRHHIIKYEGVIQKGHEGLVHHMELFHCEVHENEIVRDYNGPGEAEGKPAELKACRRVIGAWAMGAKALVMPAEAGIPIGGAGYSRYAMLEVHYNNPSRIANQIDSSGIRFYVTSHLRQHDAGVMELGLEYTNKMAIPPRHDLFPLLGFCIQQCTRVGLPGSGIHVYASQLHTHLTGRTVYTKHIRKGAELPELNRDDHYSPHFQEIRQLPVPVHVLPLLLGESVTYSHVNSVTNCSKDMVYFITELLGGDELITTCEYRTTERANATIGGFSISDEMCVNYIHYYPLVPLEVCKSSVDTDALHSFFDFMNSWDDDSTSTTKGDRDNYNSIRWTKLTSLLLNTTYMTSPISMQCNQSDGSRFPGDWERIYPTRAYTPLQVKHRDCA